MRKVSVGRCQEGRKLAKTVYLNGSIPLICEGTELKQPHFERLSQCCISEIYIHDELSRDIDIMDVINERTRVEAKVLVKYMMEGYRQKLHLNADSAGIMAGRIIDELVSNSDIMVNLSDTKTTEDYLFAHSVNVTVLSLITGIKMGFKRPELEFLGGGALLHDIGMAWVPEDILKKPGKLTDDEFDIVKRHTSSGYGILKADTNLSEASLYAALEHHEHFDGNGYPNGTSGDCISEFARIIAVADVFDALTSDRVYRSRFKTHEAVEQMIASSNRRFDGEILDIFLKNIAFYPIGEGVTLDTGEKGLVVDYNKDFPKRPVVRIVYDSDGNINSAHREVDLAKKLNLNIVETCDI